MNKKSWSPYWVGGAIGILETVAMLTAKRPLGITTAFENAAAMAAGKLAPKKLGIEEYRHQSGQTPKIDWETGLVGGVMLGSLISARLSEDSKPPEVPTAWQEKVGRSKALRFAAATGGGALMMIGARMAKGCTSGHGISGTMQFAASSWLFDPIIFASGAVVSRALFGRKT
ncbi:MAG: YeeE/YedE thiosulfate transporter family protein [Desulfobacterales bacterium]